MPHDGLFQADGTHIVSPRPAMPPCAVACPPQGGAMTAESGLPLQPPDSLCHPILGWHAQTPRPRVGPGMPRDPGDTHWCAEFPEALADDLAERTKDGLVPIGRYDAEVVSAIPPDLAWVVPGSPGGCSCVWPWRVHTGRNHLALHESMPQRQSLFESHRQRRWLTHWSYPEPPAPRGRLQPLALHLA